MSRHHILPSIVYTPVPRPKKAESRPNIRRIQKKATAASEDIGNTEETGEVSVSGGPTRTALHPQHSSTAIDAAERRIPSTTGKLSESTLKELLLAQEQEGGPGVGGVTPGTKE